MSSDPPAIPSHFRLGSRLAREGKRARASELLDRIESLIDVAEGQATVSYGELTLQSAFQPVINLAHGRPVGYETLLRARDRDDNLVYPLDVFAHAGRKGESTFLDGLCHALHLKNAKLQNLDRGWIFLNLNPRALMEAEGLAALVAQLLDKYQVPPHRLVVEIIEATTFDEVRLAETVSFFRQLGCLIAIDDFGAGQSNFERVWRIAPDLVKLDRSMLSEAQRTPRVRRILPGLASLVHEAGCLVVMEGIENEEQALIALEMDVDFVQGFYFARPEPEILGASESCSAQLTELFSRFRDHVTEQVARARESLLDYSAALEQSARTMHSGADAAEACRELLARSGVDRCYVLDQQGNLVTMLPGLHGWEKAPDPRYEPLADTADANWFRRPYFRRALTRPMNVQLSQPYLSTRDARSCVTISIAIPAADGMRVLCADLDWESSDSMLRTPSWRPPMMSLSDIK